MSALQKISVLFSNPAGGTDGFPPAFFPDPGEALFRKGERTGSAEWTEPEGSGYAKKMGISCPSGEGIRRFFGKPSGPPGKSHVTVFRAPIENIPA